MVKSCFCISFLKIHNSTMLNEKGNCTYVTLSSCYHEWGLVVICAACIDISSIFNQTTQNLTRGIRTTEGIVTGCFTTFVLKTDISSMFNEKVTALMWPFSAANIRGVWSSSLQPALTSAPFSIQQLKISHGASEPRTAWWRAGLQFCLEDWHQLHFQFNNSKSHMGHQNQGQHGEGLSYKNCLEDWHQHHVQ